MVGRMDEWPTRLRMRWWMPGMILVVRTSWTEEVELAKKQTMTQSHVVVSMVLAVVRLALSLLSSPSVGVEEELVDAR